MYKFIFIFLSVAFSSNIFSQVTLQNYFNEISTTKDLENSTIGFYVFDISNNEQIFNFNENKSLKPASNLKILTTASVLETYGANYQFKTLVKYSGKISENKLNGSIYVIGGGDPTLGSKYFFKNKTGFIDNWVSSIKEKGIKKINGNIIIVDTLFKKQTIPSTWLWGDIGNYYGAGVSSVSVFDNQYKIFFNTNVDIDDTVKILKIEPEIQNLKIINNVTAQKIRRDKSNIYGVPFCDLRIIEGSLPVNKDSFIVKGSIPNPALVLAQELKKTLIKNGIQFNGKLEIIKISTKLPELKTIHTTYSPKLISIIDKTNKSSVNMFAETLFRHLSISRKYDGSNSKSASVLKYYWKNRGVDISAMNIYDGSGLSPYNLISTKEIVQTLQIIEKDSLKYPNFIETLPVAGKSGTLRYFLSKSPAKENVFAKSGSMSGVRAYSGYVKSKKGNILAFSVIVNNYTCHSSSVKKYLEKLIELIYLNY